MFTSTFSLRRIFAGFALLLAVAVPAARAQTNLYITDGDSLKLQAINTSLGSVIYTATTTSLSYPIAVRNTIWLGHRDNSGLSREYNLSDGTPTGQQSTTAGVSWSQSVDGAVNGSFNYTFAGFSTSTTVYQTSANWTNAVALFQISGATGNLVGITFDTASGNLWVSSSNSITQYTLGGAFVSRFTTSNANGPLAYQASTDTLWVVPNSTSQPLVQFSKTGTVLQTVAVAGRASNVWGAEFSVLTVVPEPSTYVLLALGATLLAFTHRRRRTG